MFFSKDLRLNTLKTNNFFAIKIFRKESDLILWQRIYINQDFIKYGQT